jgi:hypothetical protein
MLLYGGKPRYGAGIAHYILPYLYTTTKTRFLRNQFIAIAIAPLVVISLVGICLMAALPSIAHWIFIPLVLNASGAVGDLWVIRNVLRYPKHVLLEDRKTGLIIYGKETDKTLNITTAGFGTRFSKVFILCFTIGPTNSLYTIFEFHSSVEGFGLSLFPMSMLAISVIAGLIYAIIMTGKPSVSARENHKKFDEKNPKKHVMGLSIGIGLVIGAGLGVVAGNIGAGMGTGLVLGVAVGYSVMEDKAKKEKK